MRMSNRERVLARLRGERSDKTPFSIYEWKIPWGHDKRMLCERGLTMLRRFSGWKAVHPACDWKMITYVEHGKRYEREIISTPKGEITALFLPDQTYGVRKQTEYWVKVEADYERMIAYADDAAFVPAFDEIHQAKEDMGDDGLVFVFGGYSPLQEIMLHITGIEQFCYDIVERPEAVFALYDALFRRDRRLFPILAKAPVELVQYDANHVAKVLGRERFVRWVLPCLDECADVLHEAGKLQSVHVDGDNAIWAQDLAASKVDIIEAFTPAPDTDMSLAQAREVFACKTIWANFPSSMHLASADAIRDTTQKMLDEAAPGQRFLLGVTEDVPASRWRVSLNAILDVIRSQ